MQPAAAVPVPAPHGHRPAVFTPSTAQEAGTLRERTGRRPSRFRDISFRPHDFRSIFATELVNSGLPIHIGAAFSGTSTSRPPAATSPCSTRTSSATTAFLAGRRAVRPAEEYRQATAAEWREFEEHFDKRKVELGSCGRPYGTPCQHEHACLRCPVLHMTRRCWPAWTRLEADLLTRRGRAEAEGWLGEIEGIDLTLASCAASATTPAAGPSGQPSTSASP